MAHAHGRFGEEVRGPVRPDGMMRVRAARPAVEAMERRELLAVVVPALSATEGFPFRGTVATFSAADLTGTVGPATIAWGDGQVTAGTVVAAGGNLAVIGTKTYAVPGTFPVVVTVNGDAGSAAVGQGSAVVNPVAPVGLGKTVTAVAGQKFTGPVASFTDSYPGLSASSYSATVDWGDGTATAGTVQPNGVGGYDVIGTKVYNAPAKAEALGVTVVRALDGQKATAAGSAAVVSPANVLTGGLDPATDTGAADGITAVNQPTFVGTSSPYAIVTLYARRLDQAQPVALGQAISDAAGAWNLTVGALPDGVYDLGATVTPAGGQPGPLVALSPAGHLVIDTAPPVATSARADPRAGVVTVVFRDGLSGLDPLSLRDPTRYALKVGGRFRAYPTSVTVVPTAPVRPYDPVAVALRFDGRARALLGRRNAAIELGAITDVAGNPVATRHLGLWSASAPRPVLRRRGR